MNDDELAALLSRAFAPESARPPLSGVIALQRAVGAARPHQRQTVRWRRVAAATALFGTILGTSSTAFALSGAPLPRPLRVVAHGVGLPLGGCPVVRGS